MKNIRIGKDIALQWTVTVDGVSRDLSELDLRLFLHNETAGSAVELAFTTQTDVLRAEVLGRDQRNTGVYRLTLWLNKNEVGQSVLDESTAFRLVARTEMEGGTDDNNLETEVVELSGNLTTDGYRDYSELSERVEVLEQQMPVSLEADSSPDTSWLMNKNGEAVIEIGGATTQRNGFMTTNQVIDLANATQKNTEQDARLSVIERDMPNKASAYDLFQLDVRTQKKVTLVEEASTVATLAPAVDTYTRLNAAVGTLEVTLPAINASTNTYAVSLMIYLETGASPAVTFVSADNRPIVYYDGFALDANAKYEVSALFNGSKWVLANGTIA